MNFAGRDGKPERIETKDLYEVPNISDEHIVDSAVSFIIKRDAHFRLYGSEREPTDDESRKKYIRLKLRAQKFVKLPMKELLLTTGPTACYIAALREMRGETSDV